MNNGSQGRLSNKVRNLRRFTEQWQEFADAESLEFGEDDAQYVSRAWHMEGQGLDKYQDVVRAEEV